MWFWSQLRSRWSAKLMRSALSNSDSVSFRERWVRSKSSYMARRRSLGSRLSKKSTKHKNTPRVKAGQQRLRMNMSQYSKKKCRPVWNKSWQIRAKPRSTSGWITRIYTSCNTRLNRELSSWYRSWMQWYQSMRLWSSYLSSIVMWAYSRIRGRLHPSWSFQRINLAAGHNHVLWHLFRPIIMWQHHQQQSIGRWCWKKPQLSVYQVTQGSNFYHQGNHKSSVCR